jgi:hypothetical protein
MSNKKFLVLGLVLLLCAILAAGCGGSSKNDDNSRGPVTVDQLDLTTVGNYLVLGDAFAAVGPAEGYLGPWSSNDSADLLQGGAWVYSADNNGKTAAPTDTYAVIRFQTDPTPVLKYRYVVFWMKSDKPDDASEVMLKFGGVVAFAKTLEQWGITLTTDYKPYVIDLNGLPNWGSDEEDPDNNIWAVPDIALNRGLAVDAKISIDKIVFANKK